MSNEQLACIIGERRYKVERPWGVLPDGMAWAQKSKIACDARGEVYVFQRGDPPVVVFDGDGNYLRSLGAGHFSDAHGIFITDDDRVFLVDRDAHQVLIFDTEGKLLSTIGERHRPNDQAPFNHPSDVAVGPGGDIYVADGYGNTVVHRFSPDGELIRTWGSPGHGTGEFTTPHGIRVLGDGRVVVGDRENDRVQVFSAEGDYLTEWGWFYHPMDVYVDREGLIYITDQIPRLTVLRDDGTIVGRTRPAFVGPHGMAGDHMGNLYFVETRVPEITKLAPVS